MSANSSLPFAFELLGSLWLNEVRPADIPTLKHLPDLGEALGDVTVDNLTGLAAEYQRLFGFNLPPYESVFIDPSGVLNAPASTRVNTLYEQAGWSPPEGTRYGAPDHLGLELIALGEFTLRSDQPHYERLLIEHLALWAPVFCLTLTRLKPHSFYAQLGELTLDLILESLPPLPLKSNTDPFPVLPPPPTYRGTYQEPPVPIESFRAVETDQETSLGGLLHRLLTTRQAGFYLTRQDMAEIGITLDLPGVMGDREHLLKTLLQLSGQYELLPSLFEQLQSLLNKVENNYASLADTYPTWQVFARAWISRLQATRALLHDLQSQSLSQER